MDFLLKWIPRYADWGYEQLYLYLEDAFDFPSVPGVGRKGALKPQDMERLTREAARCKVTVIPIVPLLGHTAYLMKTPQLMELSERRDANGNPLQAGQICPLHDGTLGVARKLLKDIAPYCTAGLAHVGLDESFEIGQCPRCRKEIGNIGLARHFAGHAARLNGICRDLGLRMGIWADMLYYIREAIPLLPDGVVAYDWFYYPFKKLPRVELYNFAEIDLTGELRKAGVTVFGCPNNGPFFYEPMTPFSDRLRNIVSWWHYCRRKDAQGMLITSWSPVRTAIELNCVVDAAAASLWLDDGLDDPQRMLELGWQRAFGASARPAARIAAASEKYQYTGYYRWQTFRNWKAFAHFDSLAPARREERHFRTLTARCVRQRAPIPLRHSLALRHYLSRKDLFIQQGAQVLLEARRCLQSGQASRAQLCPRRVLSDAREVATAAREALRSARVIWSRSRSPSQPNANEQTLLGDLRQLRDLQACMRAAIRTPTKLLEPNPLVGRWQLLFWVRNFAPALQGVAVEIADGDCAWKTVHSLYSLEFTAEAGRSRADFRRHHSVAVDWDTQKPLKLKLAVRGLGELEIFDVQLTNGPTTLFPARIAHGGGPARSLGRLKRRTIPGAILGVRAPRSGFPSIEWSANAAWVELEFSQVLENHGNSKP